MKKMKNIKVNGRRTDNTMAKRKWTKRQTTIYNKTKDQVSAPLKSPVVLRLQQSHA
jgi:hypothetical protein